MESNRQNAFEFSVTQQKLQQRETLPFEEKTTELTTAAESSNWTLVDDLISANDITRSKIQQSFLLHKLAAAPEVSLSLARNIITKILKHEVDINMVDTNEDTAVVLAARCDNTKMVMELLSRQAALPPDVTHVCSFLQTLTNNWKPQETPYMHALIVKLLWDRLKDTALHSCHTQLHHTLVRLAVTFHTSLVRHMFVTQQQVNAVDSEGMAVLHRVAMFDTDDHVRLVHFLVRKGANINLQNTSGDTPLHVAAKHKMWKMLESLLLQQAHSYLLDSEQRSALHIVASCPEQHSYNVNHILRLFVRNSHNINVKDGKGNTALHLAALAGNISFMKTLLDHGARADGVNDEQKTVLHMMAMTRVEILSDSRINVFLLTIKRGADIHKTDGEGNSALHLAAKHENWALVEFLLRYLDDASQLDREGFNILHRYAMNPYFRYLTLSYELPHKVGDINTRCRTGDTAIHLAAKYQNWQIVKLLVEEGVVTDELDSEGFCILHRMAMAKKIDDPLLNPFLEEVSFNPRSLSGDTVLHMAARHEKWQLVRRLVELVENIDERDSEGLTVIQRLVVSKDEDRLRVKLFSRLVELGAIYTCRDQNGDTVLHLAARNGHWKIVNYLVHLGEQTDTPDSEGFVILHRVVTPDTGDSCVQDMLCSILKSNPELSKRTKHGDTAIHLAARYERWETVMTLIEHGANVFDCDSENISVLQQTIKCNSSFPLALPILQRTVVMHTAEHHYNVYNSLVCEAAKYGKWDLLKYLIDVCRISIRELTLDGLSLLHIIAQTKFTQYPHQIISELFKRILHKGMELEDRCPNGNTSLHLAAKSGNWDLVKYLVEQGATIQSPDSDGVFVLQRLAMYSDYCENQREFLRLLIKKGADVKVRDSNGNSLLHLGGKANNWSFISHLIQETDDLEPEELDNDGFNLLHRLALFDKSSEMIEKILSKSFNLEMPCGNGDICLLLAAKRDNWVFVKHLLEYILHRKKPSDSMLERLSTKKFSFHTTSSPRLVLDSRVAVQRTLKRRDLCGYTIWHLAVMRKQWDIIELLAECGANTDDIDDEGLDVLQRLASDGAMNFKSVANWKNFLKFLKEKGFSFDRKDGLGNTPIQKAAKNRNLDLVTLLLDHVNDVLSKDSDGLPLLYRFVNRFPGRDGNEHAEIMKRLLQLGSDPEELFWDGNTPLHLAAKINEWPIVRLLLKHGAQASTCDSEGLSVLHRLACPSSMLPVNRLFNVFASLGLPSLIRTLVEGGADVDQRDLEGNTPLHLAVQNQTWDLALSLVHCEAEVNEPDSKGYTVLHRLAQISRPIESCLSVIRLLLERDARCNILSRRRENVCDIIVENESWSMLNCLFHLGSLTTGIREEDDKSLLHHLASSYFGDEHTFVCDRLLERGFSVNFTDYDGNTPLHLAAGAGNWYLVQHLIQRGAKDKTLDSKDMSILHRFVNDIKSDQHFYSQDPDGKNLSDVLRTIISSGVDVNATDLQGNTALHLAAIRRLFYIVEDLIDSVDNLNTRDSEGFTVLLRLSQIAKPRCLALCEHLVKKGADINICSTHGESALELAVKNNNWPVVEFLFSSGALLDVQIMEKHFPIHRLIKSSSSTTSTEIQLKLMTLLTNIGLSVNMPDSDGDLPAKLAFRHKKWNLLTYLLNSGAHLNPTFTKRNSYLHELAKNSSAEVEVANITRLLINRGLDINLQNSAGDTPVHVAADEGNLNIVKTFVEHGADTNLPDRKGCFLLYKIINKRVRELWGRLSTCEITELLRTLVNHGADVNCRGPDNKTALQVAAGKDDWETVGMLIQLGGVCELTPDEKLSALTLLYSCTWKDVDNEKIKLFIKYITNDGSNINNSFHEKNRCSDKKTVLQNCIEKSNWRMAKALVECGADLSQMDTNEPILQCMISRYSESDHSAWVDFLDYFISRGLDINSKLREGSGILFHDKIISSLTCEEKVTGCLFDTLLERGADLLVVDSRGQTLLRTVLDFGEKRALNALKKLLPTGVTTHQPRFTKTIVQSHSTSSKQTVSPMKKVIEDQNISALKMLIKSGASSNAELFRLNTEYQVKKGRWANKELLEVLSMATSQPQSLKSLCRLTVSHCLGCGPGRTDKLNRLSIPPALRELVLFDELISEGFVPQMYK